jgi:hypothetical protein
MYNNASSGLTLSGDKKMVYYIANDGLLWYYFCDNDQSKGVGTENWNRSYFDNPVYGLAVEQTASNTGALYYYSPDGSIHNPTWVPADNLAICPGSNPNYYYKSAAVNNASDSTKAKEASALNVQIFPNPSESLFNVELHNIDACSLLDIKIRNIEGDIIYQKQAHIPDGTDLYQFEWNASNVDNGLYILTINGDNGLTYSGKLVHQ